MRFLVLIILILSVLSSCEGEIKSPTSKTVENIPTKEITKSLPTIFDKCLKSHGGYENWKKMKSLSYVIEQEGKDDEKQFIDLENRKTLIENTNWTIGFDGKEAWVSPNKATYGKGSPRFYHNLIFYFYAIPWVLADPGIHYKVMDTVEYHSKKLIPISCTFDSGIGDAPDDEYIIHIDTETNKMYLLLYTVTYNTKKKSDRYGALVYEKWQTKSGIEIPSVLSWYKFDNGALGEKRSQRIFSEITISKEKFNQDMFEMPENAEIDSLK